MDEEVSILKALWTARGPVDFAGKFHQLNGAQIRPYPLQKPYPQLLSRRRIEAGLGDIRQAFRRAPLLGRHLRAHRTNMAEIRSMAARHGRDQAIGFGMRLQIICRQTEQEAWEFAHELVRDVTRGADKLRQARYFATLGSQSAGAASLPRSATIEPHLWTGITAVRPGAGIAIVGTPEQCADTLQSYIDLGCHSFCLSGYLHDEEAERFGRWVMPIVRERNRERMLAA